MYEGKAEELRKQGYDAVSVRELQGMVFGLKSDYSVIKYVEKHRMILITEDKECYEGCKENQIPCIKLGQNPGLDEIVGELEKFQNLY